MKRGLKLTINYDVPDVDQVEEAPPTKRGLKGHRATDGHATAPAGESSPMKRGPKSPYVAGHSFLRVTGSSPMKRGRNQMLNAGL